MPRPVPLNSWDHYVLVVERNPELRDSYRAALRTAGVAAVGVNDATGTFRILEAQPPSALLLDLALQPVGRQIQRALRSNPETRDIPIIVVAEAGTDDVDPDDIACLLKHPIDVEALVVAVKHVLSQSALHQFARS